MVILPAMLGSRIPPTTSLAGGREDKREHERNTDSSTDDLALHSIWKEKTLKWYHQQVCRGRREASFKTVLLRKPRAYHTMLCWQILVLSYWSPVYGVNRFTDRVTRDRSLVASENVHPQSRAENNGQTRLWKMPD